MVAFFGYFLHDLDGCGACADDGDFLTPGAFVLGPEPGVVEFAFVGLETGEVRIVSSMEEAGAHDEVFAPDNFVGFADCFGLTLPVTFLHLGTNFPLRLAFEPSAVVDVCIEADFFAEVENAIKVSKVGANLLMAGETLCEGPDVIGFWNVELIVGPFRIHSSSRISIPVPNASKVGS